jgi:hypothetical protein
VKFLDNTWQMATQIYLLLRKKRDDFLGDFRIKKKVEKERKKRLIMMNDRMQAILQSMKKSMANMSSLLSTSMLVQ